MMYQAAVIADADLEIRWHDWQARGAASDRRLAARMRKLKLLMAAALVLWFFAQLISSVQVGG
jgi:hypothetical protein